MARFLKCDVQRHLPDVLRQSTILGSMPVACLQSLTIDKYHAELEEN